MKQKLLTLGIAFLMILSFAGCSLPDPVDISSDIQYDSTDNGAALTDYPGEEKHILIPEEVNGTPVTRIEKSFAEGKNFQSVTLPTSLNFYCIEDGKEVLTSEPTEGSRSLRITTANAAGVYCRFFGTNSIHINGVQHKEDTSKLSFNDLKGEWSASHTWEGEEIQVGLEFRSEQTLAIQPSHMINTFAYDYTIEGNTFTFVLWTGPTGMINPDEVSQYEKPVTFERFGDTLVCWEEGITFFRGKSSHIEEPEGEDVWVWEELDDGTVMITGYTGNARHLEFPIALDGKDVTLIRDTIANGYDCKQVSVHGFNFILKKPDGHYYLTNGTVDGQFQFIGGHIGMNSPKGREEAALCRFFKTTSIKLANTALSFDPNALTAEDYLGTWGVAVPDTEDYYYIYFFSNGGAEIHKNCESENPVCTYGTYTLNKDQITLSVEGKTATLDYYGERLVCWENTNLFGGEQVLDLVADEALPFHSTPNYVIE